MIDKSRSALCRRCIIGGCQAGTDICSRCSKIAFKRWLDMWGEIGWRAKVDLTLNILKKYARDSLGFMPPEFNPFVQFKWGV